ncbi:MAG: hypothetical protein EKK51_27950 [Mycolicibacterium sp.]|uniref:hypothetical protein n=1 Tax=Mycolicibacterium sp. TaxID=2320850 RepID=UPI000FAB5231|nr:hypothetical protein [Mycolicibacterium sp.]RUP27145.1 MAG: hypothetical protein EKK51_27950 [Mycolicibacterium sp.]
MVERAPDPDPWWSELYPTYKVARNQLVFDFAALAVQQVKNRKRGDGTDKTALGKQVNGFSVELVVREWARALFTGAGIGCMNHEAKEPFGDQPEDLVGWARVVDVYANICLPLAWYVLSYYPQLQATRPKDLPREVGSMKDLARYNAPNSLRDGLVSGFDNAVTPLFDSQEHTTAFLDDLAAGEPPHVDLHKRDIFLAFSNELFAYAEKIIRGDVRRLRSHPDAPDIAQTIRAWADDVRSNYVRFSAAIPTRDEAAVIADELVQTIDRTITEESEQLKAIELDPDFNSANPSKTYVQLKLKQECNADPRDSVRADLVEMISRGYEKTAVDAIKMFVKRRAWAVRRLQWQKAANRSIDAMSEGLGAKVAGTVTTFAETLVEFRGDATFPGGFGRPRRNGGDTAEFTVALQIFSEPKLELVEYCELNWAQLADTAVADSPDQLVEHVIEIVEWVAHKKGYRAS